MSRQTLYKSCAEQIEPWPPNSSGDGLLSAESSKEVYKNSCVAIASALEPLNFKYTKTKQRCSVSDEFFRYDIAFQSSRYNASGRHVQLWMHATVSSQSLREWRALRLPADLCTDHVAGGMVHRLGTKFSYVQWELADPADREETVSDAIQFIHNEVLPYFSLFNNRSSLIAMLTDNELPAFDLVPSVEFAYCFGDKAAAQMVLDRFIRVRADLKSAIDHEQLKPSPATLTRPGGYVQQVVFLRAHYGLA
jgi:hypothetical protein